jgi:hypothetical protein
MRDTIGIWNASGAAIQVVAFMFSRLGRPRKGENRLGLCLTVLRPYLN